MQSPLPLEIVERIRIKHPDASLAVIGCHAAGVSRPYCEVNVAAYPAVGRPWTLAEGKKFYEVIPITNLSQLYLESEKMEVVTDDKWSFASLKASFVDHRMEKLLLATSMRRLTTTIKHLGIVYSSQANDRPYQATLNLLAAAAKYSEGVLLLRRIIPHPSHLVEQMKTAASLNPVATVLDFDQSTESAVKRRVAKLVAGVGESEAFVLNLKVNGLLQEMKPFDAMLYLDWFLSERSSSKDPRLELASSSIKIKLDERELRERADLLLSYVKRASAQQRVLD
ncbi:MAG TPA: hypothetical protein VMS77_02465 [Conexivisphaerales archaeon]|nr:hypothetical protein [Conexivisphaerales archaeon]